MQPRWRPTTRDDAWRTSDRVAASYALKHGPATSGIRPVCSTPLLGPGNADQSRRQPVEIDGKLMDVIVTRPRDYKQLHRRSCERFEALAVRERDELVVAAVDQQDRAFHVADNGVGTQRILQDPPGSPGIPLRRRTGEAGKGRPQHQQLRMDVACERRGQRGAEGAAVDHDRLIAIERGHGIVRSAGIGIQLRLTFDATGALAVTSIIDDEQVVVDAPIEVHTGGPRGHIADVAMQEKHDAARIRLLEMQRVQGRTLDGNPHFLEWLVKLETEVGRQYRPGKDQPLLREVKRAQGAGVTQRDHRGEYPRGIACPTRQEFRHLFAYTR